MIAMAPPPQKQKFSVRRSHARVVGKKIKVPFLPDPSKKPVYCKSCLKKMEKEETISLA
jgi:CxxC-x17-CxxC domain-containing protein